MDFRRLDAQDRARLKILRVVCPNMTVRHLPVIVRRQKTFHRINRADRVRVVVNRAALTRFPAQNEAFEICAFVDEIPGVLLLGEMDMWFNFRTINLQSGYESPEVRKLHFPRGVL